MMHTVNKIDLIDLYKLWLSNRPINKIGDTYHSDKKLSRDRQPSKANMLLWISCFANAADLEPFKTVSDTMSFQSTDDGERRSVGFPSDMYEVITT